MQELLFNDVRLDGLVNLSIFFESMDDIFQRYVTCFQIHVDPLSALHEMMNSVTVFQL